MPLGKLSFLHTLPLENEERPSQKKSGATPPRYNEAHMPKLSYSRTPSKWPKNPGDVPARGLSIGRLNTV